MSIFANAAAYKPFFDETVRIGATRPNRTINGSFAACVLDGGYDEAIDEEVGASSRLKLITVIIRREGDGGWNDEANPPQVGDVVTLEHGVSFGVTSVNLLDRDCYTLECRQS